MKSVIEKRTNPFTGKQLECVVLPALPAIDEPSVFLKVDKRSEARTGCRFGGPALLPKRMKWPSGPSGPLSLIGQLDFGELAKIHRGRLALPDHGVLSFFYDTENQPWGFRIRDAKMWRLVYVEDPDRATLHEPEDDDPAPGRALEPMSKAPKSSTEHRVGGAPGWVQNDARAAVALLAGEQIDINSVSAVRAAEAKGIDVRKLAAAGANWRLLWQIDSDDAVDFTWGDVGKLYVLIEASDLAACRFDRAWVVLQCH